MSQLLMSECVIIYCCLYDKLTPTLLCRESIPKPIVTPPRSKQKKGGVEKKLWKSECVVIYCCQWCTYNFSSWLNSTRKSSRRRTPSTRALESAESSHKKTKLSDKKQSTNNKSKLKRRKLSTRALESAESTTKKTKLTEKQQEPTLKMTHKRE